MTQLILASSSPYRAQQLKDFGLAFTAVAPKIDEESLKTKVNLSPLKLSQYLAKEKALSLAKDYPEAVILGGDQLISLGTKILGKPGSAKNAEAMLKKMSGKTHKLITSIVICYGNKVLSRTVIATIQLRKLSAAEIKKYVELDNPVDCSGSYKFERAGFSLVKKISVSDPSSMVGIPLIELTKLLLSLGLTLPFKDMK